MPTSRTRISLATFGPLLRCPKMSKPNPDVRRGSRIERAAWMKEVAGGLYSFVYKLCEDLKIIDEAADNVASSVVEHFREFGQGRARRTALRPGGVGRR
jgi:hypothetical protein